jgi:tRNA pseudouridine55 synthase
MGKATKIVPYLINKPKTYLAQIKLGVATTTEDFTGEIVCQNPVQSPIDRKTIITVLNRFRGEIEQIPPMYSAVKVKGKKLYEWAREGIEIERPSRRVVIHQIELVDYQPEPPFPEIKFLVTCSKGTYVRTLGVDIGRSLGYPAHLISLCRTKSGPFTLKESVTVKEIQAWSLADWRHHVQPIDKALKDFPFIRVDRHLAERIKHGQNIRLTGRLDHKQLYRIYDPEQQLIALASAMDHSRIKPEKVLI